MNLIDRAKNSFTTPKTEGLVIKTEQCSVSSLLTSYVLPLALIPAAIALLTGLLWTTVTWGLIGAVIALINTIVSFYVATYITDALAPSFSSEKNLNRSAQLVAYSYTATAVASILGIIPLLGIIALIAGFAYSIYLMYLGIGPIKNTPEEKRIGYVIVIIIVQIIVYWILSSILASILFRSFYYNY